MAEGEKFNFKKFIRGLNLMDPIGWAKSLSHSFRVAIILGLIALGVFGYGYWKGYKTRPVNVDIGKQTVINLKDGEGKVHKLESKNGLLYFDGKLVRAGDIPKLKPYGVELHPKLVAGVTSSGNPAAGLGLEVAHFYRANLDVLALYKFLGIGISYDITLEKPFIIDNSAIGLGVGRDFSEGGGNAVLLYYTLEF